MDLWTWSLLLLAAAAVILIVAWRRMRRQGESPRDHEAPIIWLDQTGQAFVLKSLPHRAADHTTADAVVRIADDFDNTAPIHLIVYNHGFYTNVENAYNEANLAEQMKDAPPNSVLCLPEWQKRPGATSGDQGRFKENGMFAGMVQDAFDRIQPLKGRTLEHVQSISVLSHSAGYNPAETILYRNGLEAKIRSVTLLDALYDHDGFNRWLEDNMQSLASGRKRFYNFFYGTAQYSKDQAAYVKELLADAGLKAEVVEDYDAGDKVMDASEVAKHSFIFKYSSAKVDDLEPHFSIPNLYVGPAVAADRNS